MILGSLEYTYYTHTQKPDILFISQFKQITIAIGKVTVILLLAFTTSSNFYKFLNPDKFVGLKPHEYRFNKIKKKNP